MHNAHIQTNNEKEQKVNKKMLYFFARCALQVLIQKTRTKNEV